MSTPETTSQSLVRIEVRNKKGVLDPRAQSAAAKARNLGFAVTDASSARVYLIEGALIKDDVSIVVSKLLADPVTEEATIGVANPAAHAAIVEVHPLPGVMDPAAQTVTDSILNLTKKQVLVSTGTRYDFTGISPSEGERIAKASLANTVVHQITTGPWKPSELPKGHSYQFKKITVPLLNLNDAGLQKLSKDGHLFLNLEEMKAVQGHFKALGRDPSDIELETIAQTWSEHCVHKTLKATVRYVEANERTSERANEGRKAGEGVSTSPSHRVTVSPSHAASRPGHTINPDGSVTIDNLLKRTVAAATHELIAEGIDWTLSVFKDNSGVIAFDDQWAVNIKVETHNRPSAIEPYGGAATGIGGCIRDVIATGLGAKPIASTDVFCVADPNNWNAKGAKEREENKGIESDPQPSTPDFPSRAFALKSLPPGVLPPKRVLQEVVAGVRDYGNRMGIPTVSGGVFFDDRYVGNPLVFCGCIGLIPRDMVKGAARKGDRIIALGGRTGRDGIHGATFSSGELQSSSATEFAHAVQIGNAIEEKRLLDAVLRARNAIAEVAENSEKRGGVAENDNRANPNTSPRFSSASANSAMSLRPLFHGLTDCGAGGFSSAIGEMAGELGARVTLEKAPVKYAGLSYTEIWISEAQERIVLAVPPANVPALQKICDEEGVELADLGEFGATDDKGKPALILTYQGNEVGRLSMHFLHDGLPNPTREALWRGSEQARERTSERGANIATNAESRITNLHTTLLSILSHPTVASKHWIIRQYDHEVQGNTVVKPLVGPNTRGPGDAAIIEPVPGTGRGLAISQGLQSSVGDPALGGDAYWMTLASIDECVRNLVCVGTDPTKIAILDNFCWASCEKPENLGALVRAAWGCYDGAKAYRTPFVSGKDSLSNQLRYVDPATGEQKLIEIPPTLLITGMGIVPDIARSVTMDAKKAGRALIVVEGQESEFGAGLAGSMHAQLFGMPDMQNNYESLTDDGETVHVMPRVSLVGGPNAAKVVHELIKQGKVYSAHDCSEGGLLMAIAEMLIAGSTHDRPIGASLSLRGHRPDNVEMFGEAPSRYVLEVDGDDDTIDAINEIVLAYPSVGCSKVGELDETGTLTVVTRSIKREKWDVEELAKAWMGTLDW
ncbi:MAG: phosphoribosylformylglycinamidine synthase subunit PurS [Phycisphaerales bacterium]